MNSSGELEKQYKILQLAIYCDVIPLILKEHNNLSLSKLMIFSYLIKKDNYYFKSIYDAKTKKNVTERLISLLSGDMERLFDSIQFILQALDLLSKNKIIKIIDECAFFNKDVKVPIEHRYEIRNFIHKSIEESRHISDEQFMKEVLGNV